MKLYRVEMEVANHKISVKTWAETPDEAVKVAMENNKIANCVLKTVKEL